jgi:hypothetical protein
VVTISKPNKLIATKERWYMDAEKDVAVKVVNKALKVTGRHFAAIDRRRQADQLLCVSELAAGEL